MPTSYRMRGDVLQMMLSNKNQTIAFRELSNLDSVVRLWACFELFLMDPHLFC